MRTRTRISLVVVGLAVLMALVGFAAMLIDESSRDSVQMARWPHRFSAEAWRAHPRQRHLMALDLVESGRLRGQSRAWLTSKLGTPDGGGGDGGMMHWNVPSPQRPDDLLVVWFVHDVVTRSVVTSDPW